MIDKPLLAARSFLRRHPIIKAAIAFTNINKAGRRVYERQLMKGQQIEIELLGKPLQFSISTLREEYDFEFMPREEEFVGHILKAIEPNDVVFDVGANLGLVTLRIAAEEKNSTIHSFEPEPNNAAGLRRTVALNDIEKHVAVHELALADAEGTATLHVAKRSGSIHTLMASGAGSDSVTVEIATMAAFAAKHKQYPSLVKIDVEGAELAVLRGMEPLLLERSIRDIFIEIHLARSENGHKESVEEYLENRGYRCMWSEARNTEIHQHWSRIKGEG